MAGALDPIVPWECKRCRSMFTSVDAPHQCRSGGLVYLASPYSHADPEIVAGRVSRVAEAAGRFMAAGRYVYSPIAHTHQIAEVAKLPTDFAFWRGYDEAMISRCTELWVLMLDGWAESRGVLAEIEIALRHNLPIRMVAEESDACRHCDFVGTPVVLALHRSSHEARPFA